MKLNYLLTLVAATAAIQSVALDQYGKELRVIARIESNLGQNMNHALVTKGMHAGTRAGGRWGIMPRTALHILKVSKRMEAKFGYMRYLTDDQITDLLCSDESVDRAFATWLWTHLRKTFTAEQSAHAWLYGAGRTAKLSIEEIRKTKRAEDWNYYLAKLHPELIEKPAPQRRYAPVEPGQQFQAVPTVVVAQLSAPLRRRLPGLPVPSNRVRDFA